MNPSAPPSHEAAARSTRHQQALAEACGQSRGPLRVPSCQLRPKRPFRALARTLGDGGGRE